VSDETYSDETYRYAQQVLSRETTKAGRLQRALISRLADHAERDALPTSVRFLFYELEQRGEIPKAYRNADGAKRARQPAQDVSDALTVLREGGLIPWEWIVDEGRALELWRYAQCVADYLLDVCALARIDAWAGLPPPLVITESRSLAGVLRTTVAQYLCPIVATAGQSSGSLLAVEVAPLLLADPDREVIYLGDYDFQGDDIEQATRRRLEEHVGAKLVWERLALTAEQVEDFELPAIEKVDHRFRPPRPYEAVETEALRQEVIVELVRERLDSLLPEPLDDVHVREAEERRAVADFLAGFDEELR
jgi:hypothetical protein